MAAYLQAIDQDPLAADDPRQTRRVAKAAQMMLRWGTFRETPPIERVEALVEQSLAGSLEDPIRATLLVAWSGLTRGEAGNPIGAGRSVMPLKSRGELPRRIAAVEEALEIARRIDDVGLQFMAFDLLAILYMTSREEERYRQTYERALELLDRLPSRRQQVDLLVSVAGARADAGRFESALEAAEEAYRRSAELSNHERMHAVWEIYRSADPLGRWDRIAELLPWYAEAAASEGAITCAAVRAGPASGGTILVRRGDPQRAAALGGVVESLPEDTFGTRAYTARFRARAGPA